MNIELMISDPQALIFQGPAAVVVVHGELSQAAKCMAQAVSQGSRSAEAFEEVVKQAEDAVVLAVTLEAAAPRTVRGWRSVTSGHELYLVRQSERSFVLTDSFRAACASLPVTAREVSKRAVADHLLFRTVPGPHTYLTGVSRLGHGEHLTLDVLEERPQISRFEQLEVALDAGASPAVQLDTIEAALETALSCFGDDRQAANLLSGGVDSTLIHTFLPVAFPAVTVGIDAPEYAQELQYARRAGQLLNVNNERICVGEAVYADLLQATIRELALPPHHLQTVLLDAAFQSPHAQFITGQLADSLFGLGGARTLSVLAMLRPFLSLLPVRVNGLQHVRRIAQGVRGPAERLDGPAMGFGVYSDVARVERMIGGDAVHDSLRDRVGHVRAVCPFVRSDDAGFAAHLELGHLLAFFCEDTLSLWRQLAHARGRSLFAPFVRRSVVLSALAVPRAQRYVRRLQAKHLLKAILARRLPSYPVGARKLASGLPVRRFFAKGPLRGLLAEYDLPDFVPSELAETVRGGSVWLSWNCLTFVIWRDQVLRDPALTAPISTRIVQISDTAPMA